MSTIEIKATVNRNENGDGWYIESTANPKINILHFSHNDRAYHRTLKYGSKEEAYEVLYALKNLIKGGQSDNKKALVIYNSLNISRQHRESEYEELFGLYDSIDEQNRNRIRELEDENYKLRAQIDYLTNQLKVVQASNNINEIWAGEVDHFLLQAAKQMRDQWEIGADHKRRGVDILNEYISTREESTYPEYVYNEIYSAFVQNLKLEQIRSRLAPLGIECERGSNMHYHIYPIDHPEYRCVLSSTPGDFKAYKNGIKKFIQIMFK